MHTMAAALEHGDESILLVEPDPETRVLAAFMLHRLGYRVTETRTGADALELWESCGYDLLLAEALMPRLNGHDLAEKLRSRQPHLRALFLADAEYERRARKAAASRRVRFLRRPFTIATLAAAVREALDSDADRMITAGSS
jgi:CheY-like chemotaxis protein